MIGIGAALLLFYALNKVAELLPEKWEERLKPYLFIVPAFAAIDVFLVYPAILTVIYSFKDAPPPSGSASRTTTTCSPTPTSRTRSSTRCCGSLVVPAASVVLGLAVAMLADRLGPRGEKISKTIIFLPMAISMVGAATIWRFVYEAAPRASRRSAC